jgi:murein DD-endopeptidase MepM/ murein hydrolase activator NlpD
MDRPAEPAPTGWSLVVVPRTTVGEVHEYAIASRQLRLLQLAVACLFATVITLSTALGLALPRSAAYGELLDENLALRDQLHEIDARMSEVDRILLRLRLYDAQLRSLEDGEGGPELLSPDEAPPPDLPEDAVLGDAPPLDSVDGRDRELRTAAQWAAGVAQRVAEFVALFPSREGELERLVGRFEDASARIRSRPRVWPARGFPTSPFGWRRDPFLRRWRYHSGLDLAGQKGDPVYASSAGVVSRAEWHSGFGNLIEIDHGYGISTLYGHNSALLVKAGDHVVAGQRIARLGSTGRSTGPHLHFEVHVDGVPVDPLGFLGRTRSP